MKLILKILIISITVAGLQSCALLGAAGVTSQGQPTKEVDGDLMSTTANSEINVDHSQWDALLKKHVDNTGFVDYKGFKNDRIKLDEYLNTLQSYTPNNNWSVQELLAYYINSYNAYTVDLILRNYPTKSIQDIKGAFTNAFIPIDGSTLSLGSLENGVLRKMNEPRIHFAINCASISCPKLLNEAFTAGKINEQLDLVTNEFINSDKNDISENAPKLSKIFSFYTKDFQPNLAEYINQYSNTKINPNAEITFKEYNWELNEQ
jgi:hypothetical protein